MCYWHEMKNDDTKRENENVMRLVEVCNEGKMITLLGIAGEGRISYECEAGKSNIDHIISDEDELGRIFGVATTDDVWDW